MVEMGHSRNWLQCRQKLKNLKNDYKKFKDKSKQTGKGRKEWKHFELLDKILGNRDSVQPPCILESMQNDDCDVNAGQENAMYDDDLTQVDDDMTQIENSLIDDDAIQVDNALTQVDDDLTLADKNTLVTQSEQPGTSTDVKVEKSKRQN